MGRISSQNSLTSESYRGHQRVRYHYLRGGLVGFTVGPTNNNKKMNVKNVFEKDM